MPSYITNKTYKFVWEKDNSHKAFIEFGLNYDGQWDFLSYKFDGIGKTNSQDDLEFLVMLANEIAMLCKQEGVMV